MRPTLCRAARDNDQRASDEVLRSGELRVAVFGVHEPFTLTPFAEVKMQAPGWTAIAADSKLIVASLVSNPRTIVRDSIH